MPPFAGDFTKPVLGSTPATQPPLSGSPAYPGNVPQQPQQQARTIGAAMQFTEQQLGGPLVEFDSNPATSATVSIAIDGNGDRVGLVMVNVGANNILVGLTPDISNTKGILLVTNGGAISMSVLEDYTLQTRRWYAISPGGASQLYILELSRYNYNAPMSKP